VPIELRRGRPPPVPASDPMSGGQGWPRRSSLPRLRPSQSRTGRQANGLGQAPCSLRLPGYGLIPPNPAGSHRDREPPVAGLHHRDPEEPAGRDPKHSPDRSPATERELLPVLMCLGRPALRWHRQCCQQRPDLSIGIASMATQGPQVGQPALLRPATDRLWGHTQQRGDLGGAQVPRLGWP
jgi:hypothetical protein